MRGSISVKIAESTTVEVLARRLNEMIKKDFERTFKVIDREPSRDAYVDKHVYKRRRMEMYVNKVSDVQDAIKKDKFIKDIGLLVEVERVNVTTAVIRVMDNRVNRNIIFALEVHSELIDEEMWGSRGPVFVLKDVVVSRDCPKEIRREPICSRARKITGVQSVRGCKVGLRERIIG